MTPQQPTGTILSKMEELFDICRPDNDYLNEDPDASADVDVIETLLRNKNATASAKLGALVPFCEDWFPDMLDETTRREWEDVIRCAKALV